MKHMGVRERTVHGDKVKVATFHYTRAEEAACEVYETVLEEGYLPKDAALAALHTLADPDPVFVALISKGAIAKTVDGFVWTNGKRQHA